MRRNAWCVLFLSAGIPALLQGQGFGIYELGSCAMGRAGTAVAAPCDDGSAIFFNPAGLVGQKGGRASAGVTLIKVVGGFTDDLFGQKTDLTNGVIPVPQGYVSYGVTPKLAVGIGLFAPYGLETDWPTTFDGRFAGYKNIPTFREYVLVEYRRREVAVWRRDAAGAWTPTSYGPTDDVVLDSVALTLPMDLIYEDSGL